MARISRASKRSKSRVSFAEKGGQWTYAKETVLNQYQQSHDVENLFVVDGSFFPSSAAVNPGLTIIAQALRVADHIKRTELRLAIEEERGAQVGA